MLSQSILVIDTPQNCSKCPLFFDLYADMVCKANDRTIDYPYPDNKVQDWCPLKDMPEKKKPRRIHDNNLGHFHVSAFDKGFNKCIDEIL